jgi:hypothetical protein
MGDDLKREIPEFNGSLQDEETPPIFSEPLSLSHISVLVAARESASS